MENYEDKRKDLLEQLICIKEELFICSTSIFCESIENFKNNFPHISCLNLYFQRNNESYKFVTPEVSVQMWAKLVTNHFTDEEMAYIYEQVKGNSIKLDLTRYSAYDFRDYLLGSKLSARLRKDNLNDFLASKADDFKKSKI